MEADFRTTLGLISSSDVLVLPVVTTDSVRQKAVTALAHLFSHILVTNGYRTDLGLSVHTWKENPFAQTELPGCDIRDGSEDTGYIAVGVAQNRRLYGGGCFWYRGERDPKAEPTSPKRAPA